MVGNLTQRFRRFLKQDKGDMMVEVGLTIGIYFLIIFMIFELGRMAITNAYWTYAVSEGVRLTQTTDLHDEGGDYQDALRSNILKSYDSIVGQTTMGLFAANIDGLTVHIDYARNLADLVDAVKNNRGSESSDFIHNCLKGKSCSYDAPLARYVISYKYHFIVPIPFISSTVEHLFTRQFFVVQIYERSYFNKAS